MWPTIDRGGHAILALVLGIGGKNKITYLSNIFQSNAGNFGLTF
jgi:hypothetical protein